ncbi:uncharacterized protein LOC131940580 [Physella acuta]|uniref:uncharacterized protein LOC131940580 n=1 Tax=Physella acuta TaxID=109671 RepID=UPI0027DD5474|nr:uncharacterized protein LOC131940580 [Physella acuta]XP_059155257.1 uncharacterized protein LOC131940580 [Physella acuta]XP_059155258.1 uncharacterized protein LOC131940580 [Physella acuta]
MPIEFIDLEELVKSYAEDFLDNDQKKHADLKNPVIDWNKMHVIYGETKYTRPEVPPQPTAHVLFCANFANNTPNNQTYTLRTERRTRSSSEICFMKTFTYGVNIQMKLTPPNPIIEANAGFMSEITKQKGYSATNEQELTWAVDSEISVPPGYKTKAELVFTEDDFNGDFEILTTFEGKILVTYESKKSRDHISTVTVHVAKVFNSKSGFTLDDTGRPTFLVRGVCKCRFGVEQNVNLTETPLNQ